MNINLKRRNFLEKSLSSFIALPFFSFLLNSCENDQELVNTNNDTTPVEIDIKSHSDLQKVGGITKITLKGYNDNNPVIISRLDETIFSAVDSICRHMNCQVAIPSDITGELDCCCHHTKYSLRTGAIIQKTIPDNIPPLRAFKTSYSISRNILTVYL